MRNRHAFRPTALGSLEDRATPSAGFGFFNPAAVSLQQTLKQVNSAYASFNHSFVNLYNRSANPRAAAFGFGPGMPGFNAQVQNQLNVLSFRLTSIASRLPNGSTNLAPNYQSDVALAGQQGSTIPFVGPLHGGITSIQYTTAARQAIGLSQYAATQDTYAYYAGTFGYQSPFIDPNFPADVFGA